MDFLDSEITYYATCGILQKYLQGINKPYNLVLFPIFKLNLEKLPELMMYSMVFRKRLLYISIFSYFKLLLWHMVQNFSILVSSCHYICIYKHIRLSSKSERFFSGKYLCNSLLLLPYSLTNLKKVEKFLLLSSFKCLFKKKSVHGTTIVRPVEGTAGVQEQGGKVSNGPYDGNTIVVLRMENALLIIL